MNLKIEKFFKDDKPVTVVEITTKGNNALNEYLNEMEELIRGLRKK